MRNVIRQLRGKNILTFDIETASQVKDITKDKEMLDLFAYKHRDKETEKVLSKEEAKKTYNKIGALSPIFGKVVSVSFGYIKDYKTGEIHTKAIYGDDEREILLQVVEILNNNFPSSPHGNLLVGYNSNRFDLPFLRARCDINGINFPSHLSDSGKKPWEVGGGVCIDLMDLIKGSMWYVPSLEEFCYAFGVPSPKQDIRGSEVSEEYHKGNLKRIAEYNERDVKVLLQIILKIWENE